MDILDIVSNPLYDNRISKIETHTYNPYANTTFENNDEIRIPIQQQDLYILPSESFLYVEGKVKLIEAKPAGSVDVVSIDNNFIAFLFDEIRYEIDGVEIDRCRNPGITTTLKNYACLSTEKSHRLSGAGWKINPSNIEANYFNYCVPLNILLGFCEDYKKIVINARHELILIRSRIDTNAIFSPNQNLKPKIELLKVQWKMPHITLEELNKLTVLRILESGRSLNMSFRSWDLYEYPLLQETTKHNWTVKASSFMEKPRYVIFALQSDRKNKLSVRNTKFDHCKLTNFRLYLNSEMYPYDDMNLDYDKSKNAILYDMYAKFSKSYYWDKTNNEPLFDSDNFNLYGPIVAIDCSRQNDSIKSGTVDVKIDFECKNNIPKNTTAYCLIIHDRIVEYNPLTNIVRKII